MILLKITQEKEDMNDLQNKNVPLEIHINIQLQKETESEINQIITRSSPGHLGDISSHVA